MANGNGIRGMAARTAGLLRQFGLPSARLTNDRPFRHVQTEIQYLAGRQDSALQVSALLPVASRSAEMTAPAPSRSSTAGRRLPSGQRSPEAITPTGASAQPNP